MSFVSEISGHSWALGLGLVLALVVAVDYLIIASPLTPEGYKSPPRPVMLVAGLAYLVGGGLILVAGQRLLLAGMVVNVLVLVAYVGAAISGHAAVDRLSLAGKSAQVALLAVLLGLVVQQA